MTSPREAWLGCYIGRRTCGREPSVCRRRLAGRDTAVGRAAAATRAPTSWTDSAAASWASAPAAGGPRCWSSKIYTHNVAGESFYRIFFYSELRNLLPYPFRWKLIPLSQLCGSSRGSLRFYEYFCRRKAAVVLRKIAEGSRFDCCQYGFFAVCALVEPRLHARKCERVTAMHLWLKIKLPFTQNQHHNCTSSILQLYKSTQNCKCMYCRASHWKNMVTGLWNCIDTGNAAQEYADKK